MSLSLSVSPALLKLAALSSSFLCLLVGFVTDLLTLHVLTEQFSSLFSPFLPGQTKDYCPMEIFNATCETGEVLVMKSARYGRMKLGRCLSTDVFIGCHNNILSQLDSRCSGRQQCTFEVTDPTLHKLHPCPKDMLVYLEASYSCEKGSTPGQWGCGPWREK